MEGPRAIFRCFEDVLEYNAKVRQRRAQRAALMDDEARAKAAMDAAEAALHKIGEQVCDFRATRIGDLVLKAFFCTEYHLRECFVPHSIIHDLLDMRRV
jgi:hypothetical protein